LEVISKYVFTTSLPNNPEEEMKLLNPLMKFGVLDYVRQPADVEQ